MELKRRLYDACSLFVDEKLRTIGEAIESNRNSLEHESKSSAGDKHETGRAMLHLEMEKSSAQLTGISEMKQVLNKIDPGSTSEHARLGSLVLTDQGNYFVSISAGPISIDGDLYYAVSPASPIGKLLMGSKPGETIRFGIKLLKVMSVV